MPNRSLHRVAELVFGRPLLVEPHQLRNVIDVLAPRLSAGAKARDTEADPQALQSSIGLAKHNAALQRLATIVEAQPVEVADGMASYGVTAKGVAVIPVVGMLTHRFDWLNAWCGIQSYDSIALAARTAAADPRVKALLIDEDTPGGEAFGSFEVGDLLAAINTEKPVWAVANGLMASAGYGLGCGAGRILAPRQSWVGSIGVVLVHRDESKADEAKGMTLTAIYSGARKVDGWGHAPLAEGAQIRLQALVDGARAQFCEHVGAHRAGVGLDATKALATEAGLFADADAVSAGLADASLSFDDALAELEAHVNRPAPAGTSTSTARSTMTTRSTAAGGKPSRTGKPGATTPGKPRAEGEDAPAGEEFTPCADCQDPEGCKAAGSCADEGGGAEAASENRDDEEGKGDSAQASTLDARLDAIQGMPEAKGHDGATLLRFARSNMPLNDVKAVLATKPAASGAPGALQLSARDTAPKPGVGANGGDTNKNPLIAAINAHGLGRPQS